MLARRFWRHVVWAVALLAGSAATGQPLDTTFTYQGELLDGGVPAQGIYDGQFLLFDAPAGGNQLGPTLCRDNMVYGLGHPLGVRFSVSLNFGDQFGGQERYLEVRIRADTGLDCSNTTGFTPLSPRQRLTGAPNALYAIKAGSATSAATATNATQLEGQAGTFYRNASNLNAGALPSARLSGTYSGALSFSNAGNLFSGSGAGLSALNASSVTSGILSIGVGGTGMGTGPSAAGQYMRSGGAGLWGVSGILAGDVPPLTLGGDLSGTHPSAAVVRLQGRSVSSTAPSGGQVLEWSGSAWAPALDNDTLYSAGAGLTLVGTVFSIPTGGVSGAMIADNAVSSLDLAYDTASLGRVTGGGMNMNGANVGIGPVAAGYPLHVRTSGERAIFAEATGSGATYAGRFDNASTLGVGVYGLAWAGSGSTTGVLGQSNSPDGVGLRGVNTAASGLNYGVRGEISTNSAYAAGILGVASALGETFGVLGSSTASLGGMVPVGGAGVMGHSDRSVGMYAMSTAGGWNCNGLWAVATGSSTATGVFAEGYGSNCAGVDARAFGTPGSVNFGGAFYAMNSGGTGVKGETYDTSTSPGGPPGVLGLGGTGVRGESTVSGGNGLVGIANGGGSWGVYAASSGGLAGYFVGDVSVAGTLSKSGGSFRIDHPLDPANRYLSHSFVESPEMLNVYSGTAVTDADGYATIDLPAWFETINRDVRYQLTVVDDGESGGWVLAKVVEKVRDNRFRIRASAGGAEVCWQVTGVRRDPWAEAHRIVVEQDKPEYERGYYLHPELYGQGADRGMEAAKAAMSERVARDPAVLADREARRREADAARPRSVTGGEARP